MIRDRRYIAFFVPSLNIGGVESVFLNYAELLYKRGYKVDFVVCKPEGKLLDNIPQGVNLVHFSGVKLRYSFWRLRCYLQDNPVGTIITGPDITNFISILINMSLSKKNRVNLIVSQHNVFDNDAKDLGFIGKIIPWGKRILYKYANKVLSVSNAVTEDLISCGVPQNNIVRISNPININKIKLASQINNNINLPDKYIAFVGRLNHVKNVSLLINAFDKINDDDLSLVIVGDGFQRKELEELARQTQSSKRIIFVGALNNPYYIINKARVIAIPSFSEAFPMVVIEAASLGKTMVYTPNVGCIEILGKNCGNGYCSSGFYNVQEFADLLIYALKNPIDAQKLEIIALSLSEDKILAELEKLL